MVGLIPLFGVEVLDPAVLDRSPNFVKRMKWFLENRPELARGARHLAGAGGEKKLLSLVDETKLRRILSRLLDETEFLSPHGVRALSRFHKEKPYVFHVNGEEHRVDYEPAESRSHIFGGNSNWRGPVWFPVNFLLVESLKTFHRYYDSSLKVECPVGSGNYLDTHEAAQEIARRLSAIFLRQADGKRPVFGKSDKTQDDPSFRDHVLFYEYFHGDTGAGLGASHQTGWTALVANLLLES
jgi:hypothetical protein